MSETGQEESNAPLVLFKDLINQKPPEGSSFIRSESEIEVPDDSFLIGAGHMVELPVGFFERSKLFFRQVQGENGSQYQTFGVLNLKSLPENNLFKKNPSITNNIVGAFGNAKDVRD